MKKCLWCLNDENQVTFKKKAHTIPKSLGGQNFNKNVCDDCNYYFGNRDHINKEYSIEEALKEVFNISRRRFLNGEITKKKVGKFKSKFFELKERNGNQRLIIKPSFRFSNNFQKRICRSFKRGLYKMFFEEFNRQKNLGFDPKYDIIRNFSRYNLSDLPVFYFQRLYGIIAVLKNEPETPILYFNRMNYLFSNDKFIEIEFLGHVFGFPISEYTLKDFVEYSNESFRRKKEFFKSCIKIEKLTDIDLALNILDR